MEKIVNINLGNYTFIIEDPAYEYLKKYIQSISEHFKNTEGENEIVSDIEIRMAELFNQRLELGRKVINLNDVQEVVKLMGTPEDFEDSSQEKKQFTESEHKTARLVYRDPDNQIIGGVCSGLSYYLGVDPLWIRLAFAISFFLLGSGLLLYILLWILIPEARTSSEKLGMKGEPIDIQNIEKNIKENMNRVKKDFKKYYTDEKKERVNTTIKNVNEKMNDIGKNVGHMFVRIIGGILMFISIFIMIIVVKALYFSETDGISFFIQSMFDESWQKQLTLGTIGGLILIPLIRIIIAGIQMSFGIKERNLPLRYTLSLLGSICFVLLIYISYVTYENFSNYSHTQIKSTEGNSKASTLYINFDTDDYFIHHDYEIWKNHNIFFYKDNHSIRFGNIELYIKKSTNDSIQLITEKYNYGVNETKSRNSTKRIIYSHQWKDSTITLSNYASFSDELPWRNQKVKVYIYIPEGKNLRCDRFPQNLEVYPELTDNENEHDFWERPNKLWAMTSNGLILK